MALSVLMVYEPLDKTGERCDYWRSYISFYERFKDGPATPNTAWYGSEYSAFRESLSKELGIEKELLEDCFFMKDEEGRYFLTPVGSKANPNVFSVENFIPLEWFLMYDGTEKKYFFTLTGFGAIRHDAIYYNTRVSEALGRLAEAVRDIEAFLASPGASAAPTLAGILTDLKSGAQNLTHWLTGFDPESFVMLNYGEICSYIAPDSIKKEDSVSELKSVLVFARERNAGDAEKVLAVLLSKWEEISRSLSSSTEKRTSTLQ
ncbi:MAG: hypothetical protein ACHQ6U_11720 [Thermodesulfobacteriota bacterium]